MPKSGYITLKVIGSLCSSHYMILTFKQIPKLMATIGANLDMLACWHLNTTE